MRIRFTLNGRRVEVDAPPHITLLELLRNYLRTTGVKRGCETGECGACTILMDGKPVNSCLILAPMAEGAEIVTVEGLAEDGRLHPIQEAFIEENALQCGYCTPGFLITAKALLDRVPEPSVELVKDALTGNICRCGAYRMIISAVLRASEKMRTTSASQG